MLPGRKGQVAATESTSVLTGRGPSIVDLILALRPKQWAKNIMVFAALLFSINQYWAPGELPVAFVLAWRSTLLFFCYCALSSGQYLINDLADAPQDREHPTKRNRPIASGRVSPAMAMTASVVLCAAGLA